MEGINLSSSLEKRQKESAFMNGPVVVSLVFFLLLASWGGMRWYLKVLGDNLTQKTALLQSSSAQLRGDTVDRIVNFDTRLTLAKKQGADTVTNTDALLNQLERLVIPNVKLTKYEFNKKDKTVVVSGETDNFKYVAQQLVSFKGESPFVGMGVESLKKNETGRILFSFKSEF